MDIKNLFPDALKVKQLAAGFFLLIWIDDEDGTRHASISHADTNEQWICFASEDEWGLFSVRDHGLIPGQYLNEEQLKALENIGIKPGNEFVNFEKFLEYAQF
jgi:NAD(P)H-flavin reductase